MASSTIWAFSDPYEYQKAIRAADVKLLVEVRGEFEATLTRIDLDRVWMQRSRLSLPSVSHSADHKDRSSIFFLTGTAQLPIYHSGIGISAGEIVVASSGAEHHVRAPANYRWGAMSLSPGDLAAAGRALAGRELTAPPVRACVALNPP